MNPEVFPDPESKDVTGIPGTESSLDTGHVEMHRVKPPRGGWWNQKGLWIGLGVGLVVGSGLTGMRLLATSTPATETEPSEEIAAQSVTVATVEPATVTRSLDATGTVMAFDLLPILPKSPGLQIQQVLVDEGDRVSAGQVLVVLDDSLVRAQISEGQAQLDSARSRVQQQQAALAQTRASLAEAESNLQRYQGLSEDGAVSRQTFDTYVTAATTQREAVRVAESNVSSAQAEVRSQQARIQQLETQLEQTLVRSPADGVIAERLARVGNVTSSSEQLFTLIRDRLLELQVRVPETQLPQISPGASAQISSDADPRIRLQGQVREIAPTVDPQTRQATVRIDLPDSDLLRPGMFLRAALTLSSAQGLTVPAQAVLPQVDGSAIVYRLEADDRVVAQAVEVGERMGNGNLETAQVEIKQGLNAGDRVVVAGASYVKDGDRVSVVSDEL